MARVPENPHPLEILDSSPVDPRVHHVESIPTSPLQPRGESHLFLKAKKMDGINTIFSLAKVPEHSTIAPVVVVESSTVTPPPPPTPPQPQPVNPAKSKSPSLITKPVISANHAHIHQFSVNQADYQEEKAERSRQTVGAAWALTLGNN